MSARRSMKVARRTTLALSGALTCWLGLQSSAQAQLQVTEIMSNPLSPNDNAWEWIEVRNTGAAPIDLNGYIAGRLGDTQFVTPAVNSQLATNTIVPAGGVAVLYDADLTGAGDYNDGLFRTAWGLAPSVPLIGTRGFALGLTNSGGSSIGFWQDASLYNQDVADDGAGTLRINQFTNAAFSIDFRTTNNFPAVSEGTSIRWSGNGSYQDGANWGPTTSGTTSVIATLAANVNSPEDIANPGVYPIGTAPSGLSFTEVMYNPRSGGTNEVPWEWVEVFNNTGATIDFGVTPYVFDDDDDNALTAANITSGAIPSGTGAVLFNANATTGVTLATMQAAWDNGLGINFIPVSTFTQLAQAGDKLGLWPSFAAYSSEATTGQGRTMANVVATVTYDDEALSQAGVSGTWPTDDGNGSIHLVSFDSDPTVGDNWALSSEADGISIFANAINGTVTVHDGGDLGTPGVFSVETASDADFNNDNIVDGADFLIWQRGFGTGSTNATGDADGNGAVDAADLAAWKAAFGGAPAVAAVGAVPEPASLTLAGLAVIFAAGAAARRR